MDTEKSETSTPELIVDTVNHVVNDKIDKMNNIYRYKFTSEVMDELYKFGKLHQYEHRKDFKESWTIWIEENKELIDVEIRRLKLLDYNGNILDKMFKSARYYFRKKNTTKKEPAKRRHYVSSQKELLEAMDIYIRNTINIKPSVSFDDFCNKHIDLLKNEIKLLHDAGFTDSNEIKNKIKKTYKNRYNLQK